MVGAAPVGRSSDTEPPPPLGGGGTGTRGARVSPSPTPVVVLRPFPADLGGPRHRDDWLWRALRVDAVGVQPARIGQFDGQWRAVALAPVLACMEQRSSITHKAAAQEVPPDRMPEIDHAFTFLHSVGKWVGPDQPAMEDNRWSGPTSSLPFLTTSLGGSSVNHHELGRSTGRLGP